jgi:hypothetical protein
MLVVFHNRHHPKIRLPRPDVRQPGDRVRAVAFRLVAYFVVAGLLVLAAWTAYDVGRQQAGFDSSQARKLRRELSHRVEVLENERDELLQRVASLQRTVQIDREAARQVRQSLLELQDERLQLKEEIAFLGSLMSDGKTKAGLRIRRFVLETLDDPGSFRYRFGLSKFPQDGEELRATLELTVIGRRGGTESVVVYKDAALGPDKGEVAFKQLVQVEGALKLPSGFEPQRLKIVVKPEKDDVLGVERELSWVVGS